MALADRATKWGGVGLECKREKGCNTGIESTSRSLDEYGRRSTCSISVLIATCLRQPITTAGLRCGGVCRLDFVTSGVL
ncbi:hypothetical protein E2C01_001581 [Portunus trituberculatus]|uniref:Uncharacterized protein n=1 Tax=Portunus trituberculatus TaxID=210409 RepID=A0A5B7CH05_PORTR|nr:hypothetical protein [Portunus trituberculatus]